MPLSSGILSLHVGAVIPTQAYHTVLLFSATAEEQAVPYCTEVLAG
jgi:hypothetical protein